MEAQIKLKELLFHIKFYNDKIFLANRSEIDLRRELPEILTDFAHCIGFYKKLFIKHNNDDQEID